MVVQAQRLGLRGLATSPLWRGEGDEAGRGWQNTTIKQGSYEGHGKTSVAILNEDSEGINMIDSYSMDGFRLNDDTKILGPCVVFPTAVLGEAEVVEVKVIMTRMIKCP